MVTLLEGGADSKISRTSALEFQNFQHFPRPMPFPGLSRPGNLNILNLRSFQGLYEPWTLKKLIVTLTTRFLFLYLIIYHKLLFAY